MLKIQSLSFDYCDKPLLKNLEFMVNPGTLVYLQGKNGAGKTTLLKLLAGLFLPQAGLIKWQNQNIHNDLAAYQKKLCFVGHKLGLNSLLTLRENYLFELKESNLFFNDLLKEFDLTESIDKPVHLLSQGQRKRGALLRLCLSKAKIWLLDEPLSSLDKDSIEILLSYLKKHLEGGGLIIMSSHQSFSLNLDYIRYNL